MAGTAVKASGTDAQLDAADGDIKDYEIFTIPFITVTEKLFAKIRNLTYRYMPNQLSLFE